MNVEEIRRVLHASLPLRFPTWDPALHPAEKIAALEDYLAVTAVHRGELEEAMYWAREAEKVLLDRWAKVEGWQAIKDRRDTNEAVDDAKRTLAPDIWDGLDTARRLIYDLGRQIKRLEKDYDAVSRDYSFLTGS